MHQYTVTGMSCAACQSRVEKAVLKVDGVSSCAVSLLTNSMSVEGTAPVSAVIKAVKDAGYEAKPQNADEAFSKNIVSNVEEALTDKDTPLLKKRLFSSLAFLILLMYVGMGHNMAGLPLPLFFKDNFTALSLTQMLLALLVILINNRFFKNGYSALWHKAPSMDTLVALGSSVSFLWSLIVFYKICIMTTESCSSALIASVYRTELYFESAAMIPCLITIGKLLEAMAKGRTTNALKTLLLLAPKTAVVLKDGKERIIDASKIEAGDVFILRPGSQVPADGFVLEGSSTIDESALTGESIPVDKGAGDRISAATLNTSGILKCKATGVGEDTVFSKILQMVFDAASTKAPIVRIADKVSAVFVPTVIGISLIVIITWLIVGENISFALARGISVLIISCPCAIGLATPVAIMVGGGLGARNGILFKTAESLEMAGRITTVALDKTGTITQGKPEVTDIYAVGQCDKTELLKIAYSLEKNSEHPLAKSIVRFALDQGVEAYESTQFCAVPGKGAQAIIQNSCVHGGNLKYIASFLNSETDWDNLQANYSNQGKTPLFFEKNGGLLGIIALADALKPDSAKAIQMLHSMGIKTAMITGDNEQTARVIAQKVGIKKIVASVLPDQKKAFISSLSLNEKVAMVGDGINDSPALTAADVGIAIGAGTDVAIDSADIVLINSNLTDVAAAIRIGRMTLRNIRQNLFWAFFYNLICIPLAAGLFVWKMHPMFGAAAMSLSSFTVCMNALRLNLKNPHDASKDKKRIGEIKEIEFEGTLHQEQQKNEKKPFQTQKGEEKMEKAIKVEGMMCCHCEARVKKALETLDFVKEAIPNHEKNEVFLTLEGDFNEEGIRKIIEENDYQYKGIA